jgi:uncharacterized membrane protein
MAMAAMAMAACLRRRSLHKQDLAVVFFTILMMMMMTMYLLMLMKRPPVLIWQHELVASRRYRRFA